MHYGILYLIENGEDSVAGLVLNLYVVVMLTVMSCFSSNCENVNDSL